MNWLAVLFPYRTHLETELKQQRADFETRLAEKNLQIRVLRCEVAAAKRAKEYMEPEMKTPMTTLTLVASNNEEHIPQDWQGELSKMLKEEEDGIRSRGRIQEHEPRADDGA